MARSKEKFFKLLEAKGIDKTDPSVAEFINEFDGDFAAMNAELSKQQKLEEANKKWAEWYQTRGYQVDTLEQERNAMADQLRKLRDAGVSIADLEDHSTAKKVEDGVYVTPQQLASLKEEIFGTFSSVTKDLLRIQGEHIKSYGEVPDLDAIEQIVVKENIPARMAYDRWVQPKREARQKEDTEKEISRRVQEALKDERSKMGVAARPRKQSDAVSPMADFVSGRKGEKVEKRNTIDKLNKFVNDMNAVEPSGNSH